jgi:glucokinase-like ROK family protein
VQGVDLAMMRSVNRTVVLDLIRRDGPISRTEIAKASRLAKPTVSAIVDDLLDQRIVREAGRDRPLVGAGRPSVLLEFNADSRFVVGLYIGVQKTIIVLANAAGDEAGRVQTMTPEGEPGAVLGEVATLVEGLLSAERVGRGRVAALGVCIAGLVDPRSGVCLLAPNLGWRNVPVLAILEERLGIETFVHNKVQAAAVAEDAEGAGRGTGDLVLLYTGLGVGAGVIQDGRIFHGTTGIAAEIGHCVVPGATERCGCGRTGCLETLASAPAVVRAARRATAEGRPSRLAALGDDVTPYDVTAAANAGDGLALEILREAGRALGIAASWLVNLFNPAVLVIGGGFTGAGDPLLEPFRATLDRHALPQATERLAVRHWALGADSKARGAVLLALHRSDKRYRVVFGD